ncbi:hypothetical protein ACOSQ3_004951 [Xanthoceras sorbifolium]
MSDSSSTSNSSIFAGNQSPMNPPIENSNHPVKITTIKLNGDNFLHWSLSVQMYIRGRGKLGYLTGDKAEPPASDAQYTVWDAENSIVMVWLVNSMEEEISANYLGFSTAREMWENLKAMYSDLGNHSQIYEIHSRVREAKQGTNSVTKYFAGLKRLWQDLDMFYDHKWKNSADGIYFNQIIESSRIFTFLVGLNIEFDEVRGRIIGRQPLPSINEVFAEVRREQSRRLVMLGKKNGESSPVETFALVSQEAAATVNKIQTRKNDERPKVWCDFCNKPRHTKETCWKLHGKPANWKPRERSGPTAHSVEQSYLNKEQMQQLLKLIPSSFGSTSLPNSFVAPHRYYPY